MRLALQCLLAAVAAFAADKASARTKVLTTEAGSVVHWTRDEITVGIDASAASRSVARVDVAHAIQRAARAWNRVPASQPHLRFVAEANPDVTVRFCRGKWLGETIDLGRTQFTASPRDGAVTSAVIELNECDHHFSPPGEEAVDPFDLQSVMTHEFGHVLGLGHSDLPTAIMFPSGNGVLVRTPSADDETALALIYIDRESLDTPAPPSGPRLVRAPPSAGAQPGAKPPASAGRASPSPRRTGDEMSPPAPLPTDSVSVLSIKSQGGREMVVYTCEPTLLPPLAESQPTSKRKAKTHNRAKRRR
ncbi:MAG: matrixin family metalloprotease [Deltaproteobacteria bacterium]|nr:matrixin family metalloprotease [Deltaproteobacteria bacterium]